ncbi:hypothetical protein [Nocardioides abyssi]|uniref:DUF4386 family protein n=1 Tax=Nocardioides abyssi TaxID=3058370 RepID=A0ABT8EWI5_9ACTN|nr:hypothetical protein [Nocardioides abyssi]MDN4162503.1 hypothetical protein [Nocardioides abyssi]
MRSDWLPISAAMLVTGAMALALGRLVGDFGGTSAQTLRGVQADDGRWLAVAVVYFLAAACLTLGLPAVLELLRGGGRYVGGAGVVSLAIGFLGLAGFSMLIVSFRALIVSGSVDTGVLAAATEESGLAIFLRGWLVAILLGELLLAAGLLRAGPLLVPRWIPALLAVHLAAVAVGTALPPEVARLAVVLLAVALAGIGITAARPHRHPSGARS